jgi:hypothetical protein
MLSRVRTGMANTEMTCAIPGPRAAGSLEAWRQILELLPSSRLPAAAARSC